MGFTCKIQGLEEIDNAAKKFIDAYPTPAVFAFYGKMGAGKTTFIKAVCQALGAIDYVTSPSFAIINEYNTNTNDIIYHFDFYRIKKIEEAFDLGYEDYFFGKRYCFIEWPEKIESLLPDNVINVTVTEEANGSRLIETNP